MYYVKKKEHVKSKDLLGNSDTKNNLMEILELKTI